jgi:ribonucleoside-diphosphate reductase alpha chain
MIGNKLAEQQTNKPTAAEKRAEANAHGFESEVCRECGYLTLVRAGACHRCTTCGATTGCS